MTACALPVPPAPADDPLQSPLGPLKGARPPAPEWFEWAVAQAPERSTVRVDGADIEMLAWGRRGDPGLLLLHGFGAHADWWSFIAPFFAVEGRRVVAISWSGMGLSGRRDHYRMSQHVAEAAAAAAAGGLFDSGEKPVVVGHSYGGFVTLAAAAALGERLKAVVAVDSPMSPDDSGPPRAVGQGAQRIYPTLQAALARFRFAPPQTCENLFIVDHIARYSLEQAPDGGWSWRFDPALRSKMEFGERGRLLGGVRCPVALMIGARSKLMTPERLDFMRRAAPDAPWVDIPDAGHHVMADQPLAFVAALRGLLAGWRR